MDSTTTRVHLEGTDEAERPQRRGIKGGEGEACAVGSSVKVRLAGGNVDEDESLQTAGGVSQREIWHILLWFPRDAGLQAAPFTAG